MGMEKQTVNIHGKEYETVASRVARFTEQEPDLAIITELIENTDEHVIMKASIIDENDRVRGTGYAEEQRGSTQINRTSALENCETSAIGRALAAIGYAGTEYASADEVANAISQQSNPENMAKARQIVGVISDKQVGLINAVANKIKINDPETYQAFKDWYKTCYHNKPVVELTKQEAKEVIDQLKKMEHSESEIF